MVGMYASTQVDGCYLEKCLLVLGVLDVRSGQVDDGSHHGVLLIVVHIHVGTTHHLAPTHTPTHVISFHLSSTSMSLNTFCPEMTLCGRQVSKIQLQLLFTP